MQEVLLGLLIIGVIACILDVYMSYRVHKEYLKQLRKHGE